VANWDATALLVSIARRCRRPTSGATGWTDADIYPVINEELPPLAAELMRVRSSFFKTVADTTLTAGTASYRFNTRTIAGTVSMVSLVDSGGVVRDLTEWAEEDLIGKDPTDAGTPIAYVVRGNSVVLYPVPDAALTLRQVYYRRPNRVVSTATTSVLTITSIASAPTYAGTKPASITTSTPCDVIKYLPHFDSLQDDVTPASVVAGTSVTFSAAVTGIAVGDYICLAGESPMVQLPVEAWSVLAQRCANHLMRGGVDRTALDDGKEELVRLEAMLFGAAQDRVHEEPELLEAPSWLP
jgi:hypothetical protein